jgi:hypothetical protein
MPGSSVKHSQLRMCRLLFQIKVWKRSIFLCKCVQFMFSA